LELELVAVRLHDRIGDDRRLVELPDGRTLERGDLLLAGEYRLTRVLELVLFDEPARIAAAVTVAPARAFA
jgi:hypothetical protein